MSDYDVIVLGGGPAGEHCAGALSTGGRRVAIVERELLGGECSYYACIPSKTMLRPGEAVQAAREVAGAAEALCREVDVPAALRYRDFMVSDHRDDGQLAWATSQGIDVIRGEGRLAGPGAVEVDGRTHTAEHVVLATGSDPVFPPIDGLDGLDGVWTNREATAFGPEELPRRLVVLGAGPVGVEMAQAVRRFGSEVVVIEGGDNPLPREPRPVGEAIGEALAADGVELVCCAKASAVRRDGGEYVVELDDGRVVRGDRLLVATGRRPRVAGIGLETVGVEVPERGGLPVDERLRVTDRVWAIGDVTGIWPLTYVGKYQGRVVAANILGHDRVVSYDAVPRVVFTDPQAAAVGEAEGEVTATAPLSGVPRTATYTRDYETRPGFLTLVSDGKVLTGAHAVGPEAGEWLGQATLAVRARIPLEVLRDTIQPFPTFSEAYLHAVTELTAQVPALA